MPCLGDFEASGLGPESYPIEVGWSLSNGEIKSHLIHPDPSWSADWDPNAEALHRITRDMIWNEGLAPNVVATEMNRDLANETLYFDGGDYDRRWLIQLFDTAGLEPTFAFGDFDTLLAIAGVVDGSRRLASETRARADMGNLQLHRAAHDVRFLQRWYIRARGGMRNPR